MVVLCKKFSLVRAGRRTGDPREALSSGLTCARTTCGHQPCGNLLVCSIIHTSDQKSKNLTMPDGAGIFSSQVWLNVKLVPGSSNICMTAMQQDLNIQQDNSLASVLNPGLYNIGIISGLPEARVACCGMRLPYLGVGFLVVLHILIMDSEHVRMLIVYLGPSLQGQRS